MASTDMASTGNVLSFTEAESIDPSVSRNTTQSKEEQQYEQDDTNLESNIMTNIAQSHMVMLDDQVNPQRWPLYRKIYASAVAWASGWVVAFGLTAYTTDLNGVATQFHVSNINAILGFSIYLWGIAFAPIWTPHVSEQFGRNRFYVCSLTVFGLFLVGAGASQNFESLLICRFFAGFFGGPCLVLIEGTFADVWSARTTNSYYAILGLSSYTGAAFGPIICGFVVPGTDWRWTQWVPLMVNLGVTLFAIGVPETYHRRIERTTAKVSGQILNQSPALSGISVGQMLRITVLNPIIMLFTNPVVILCTLYLGLNFGVVFQFFLTVPLVLEGVYSFTLQQAGLAFLTAAVGAICAAIASIIIEHFLLRRQKQMTGEKMLPIEYRLITAMYGGFFMVAALFWIGWTASPAFEWAVPVLGTFIYVWGNVSVLIGIVPYLFDAYPPANTLSALTAAATFRLLMAGLFPMLVVQMFNNITGAWALSCFGFITAVMVIIPFVLFKWGPAWRSNSKFNPIEH